MKKIAFALVGLLALSACNEDSTYVSTSPSDIINRVVNISNNTGMTMTHFYASNTNMSTWGPEQLGASTVLPSGRATRIDFDDGTRACIFDFRARFSDGQELKKFGINVCVISNYNYVR